MGKSAGEPYVELHARSAFSFLRAASLPNTLAARAAEVGLSSLAITDRDGFYASPRLWLAAEQTGIRAIYGCELTMEDGSVLPLLVRNTQGYQSLCRLLTRSKLRAPKGESRIFWPELEEIAEGVVCLTGDEEGPLAHRVAAARFRAGGTNVATAGFFLWRQQRVRRGAAAPAAGRTLAQPAAHRAGPHVWHEASCHQRRALRRTRRPPGRGRVHVRAPAHPSGRRRYGPGRERRAAPQKPRADARSLCRSTCSHHEHRAFGGAAGIRFSRRRLRVSKLRGTGWKTRWRVFAGSDLPRRATPLRRPARVQGPPAARTGTQAHRGTWVRGLFPDGLGHRALLRRQRYSRPRPWQCGQLGGLLLPGDHGGRSHRIPTAVRAVPERKPWGGRWPQGVARHRPGPTQRRAPGNGHPGNVPALRSQRRRHDRQHHYPPRQEHHARDRQGAQFARRRAGPLFESVPFGRLSAQHRIAGTVQTVGPRPGAPPGTGVPGAFSGCAWIAASPGAALRGHGVLSGSPGFRGAVGELVDAGPLRHPVGQGRL